MIDQCLRCEKCRLIMTKRPDGARIKRGFIVHCSAYEMAGIQYGTFVSWRSGECSQFVPVPREENTINDIMKANEKAEKPEKQERQMTLDEETAVLVDRDEETCSCARCGYRMGLEALRYKFCPMCGEGICCVIREEFVE